VSGRIVDRQLKFTHDPIAEYVASKEIVIRFRDNNLDNNNAMGIMEFSKRSNENFHYMLVNSARKMQVNLPS